ncbi:MAG: right-handed parallel beta-helix repeat-containing protein [Candidatus Njordarchaeia archaeon]
MHFPKRVVITILLIIALNTATLTLNHPHKSGEVFKGKLPITQNHSSLIGINSIIGTAPPNSGDWNISDTTIIENEDLIINGSIFVKNGGVLILRNSTIRMNLNTDGEYWIEVMNGGNLTLINSSITAYNPDNNYYIKVDSGAKFFMLESKISFAGYTSDNHGEYSGLWINTDNVTIYNSDIIKNYYGIYIYYGDNITIHNCSFVNNRYGIFIMHGNNIDIQKCEVINNEFYGLIVYYVNNISLSNCSIYNNSHGIGIGDSENVNIINNSILDNTEGLSFWHNTNVSISGNTLIGNKIFIIGSKNELVSTHIDESNNVDGWPIGYHVNETNLVISDKNYGELILAYCENVNITNVTIFALEVVYTKNLTVGESDISNYGVHIDESSDIHLTSSKISNSKYGLIVENSYDIVVTDCIILNNWEGVVMGNSANVTLSSSKIYDNQLRGVNTYLVSNLNVFNCDLSNNYVSLYIDDGNNITVSNSNFEDNSLCGVCVESAINATFVLNNFLHNVEAFRIYTNSSKVYLYLNNFVYNVIPMSDVGSNFFDNGYYGNYWDYYSGMDENYDLVGDIPYFLDIDSVDRYPFVKPLEFIGSNIAVTQSYEQTGENRVCIYAKAVGVGSPIDEVVLVYYRDNNLPLTTRMDYDPLIDTYHVEVEIDENSTFLYQILVRSNGIWYHTSMKQLTLEDLTPPSIQNVFWVPNEPVIGENLTVLCKVTDNSGVSKVMLSYFDGSWHNVTMHYNVSLDVYQAEIVGNRDTVFFKIYANDMEGNWVVTKIYCVEFREFEEIVDNPPLILNVLWLPKEPIVGENLTVFLWVYDDYGVSNVVLSYYLNGWQNISMQFNSSIGAYFATIPGLEVEGTIIFKIYVYDTVGQCIVSNIYGVEFVSITSMGTSGGAVPSGISLGEIVIVSIASIVSLVVGLLIGLRKGG